MKKRPVAHILLTFIVLGICVPAKGAETEKNGEVSALRSTLEKWVETRQLISREKQKWQAQKQILIDRTRLLEGQVQDLDAKIEEARVASAKAEQKREKVSADSERLETAILGLREQIAPLEKRVMILLNQLPDPLREQVKPLSQLIPAELERADLSISTRYQNLIGVLNFINKFNNAVTVTTEVRNPEGDQPIQVKVMYLGLGQAFFCNEGATVGGIGRPTTEGWKWERRDNIAPDVSSAIAMYHNERQADYVALPVEIVKLREERK